VVAALLGVALALAIGFALISMADEGTVEFKLGDDVFDAGSVGNLLDQIEEGGPVLFPDASDDKDRDVYIQHVGDDRDEGWLAIAAHPPGESRECFLRWLADGERFVDCRGETYPADGGDQERFDAYVEDGRVFVDFRAGDE
jgi:hypothetical protein